MRKVTVPEGEVGVVKIKRFHVSKENSRFASFREGSRAPSAGEYTKLIIGGQLVMSDTNAEMRDHLEPVRMATGNCLIGGLGIGMVLQAMLDKDCVDHVTVIEKSSDVIGLVADHYLSMFGRERLEIINADVFEWKPSVGQKFDVVWHDIWPDISTDNLKQMHRLHRRFGRRAKWQGSWSRKMLESIARREKNSYSYGW